MRVSPFQSQCESEDRKYVVSATFLESMRSAGKVWFLNCKYIFLETVNISHNFALMTLLCISAMCSFKSQEFKLGRKFAPLGNFMSTQTLILKQWLILLFNFKILNSDKSKNNKGVTLFRAT